MQAEINDTILGLDHWLATMRQPGGYGGPVAHWWESSLIFCGPMIDWRYEGIICGYLTLYRATDQRRWLARAVQAGEDCLAAQLPDGRFRNSSFQRGALEGGTPHEAAVDVGLLELALALRADGDPSWRRYFTAAELNLRGYQIERLWGGEAFIDEPGSRTQVANKNATTLEALLLYRSLGGDSVDAYIAGAGARSSAALVREQGPRQGATIHLGTGAHRLTIGIYTARCAAALVRLYREQPTANTLEMLQSMAAYLERLLVAQGSRFGHYADGRLIACPTWVSPSGDLLRALLMLRPHATISPNSIGLALQALLQGRLPSGGLRTAHGLGQRGDTRSPLGPPDLRDLLPVAGWCDKAFRALALLAPSILSDKPWASQETMLDCRWRSQDCLFHETTTTISVVDTRRSMLRYEWKKATWYPAIYQL